MQRPILFWFRRDLRLCDHAGLSAAVATGAPVIAVFILDPETEAIGAAPKWRLGEGLRIFSATLEKIGTRLILRKGGALEVLSDLVAETDAQAVYWSRSYDPDSIARDSGVKAGLRAQQIDAVSFPGHVLFEPWEVSTLSGGPYKVYTPFWRAVRGRDTGYPLPAVNNLTTPEAWPKSEDLSDWALGAAIGKGGAIVGQYARIGEGAAAARLACFVSERLSQYAVARDDLALEGTSGLSENLTFGEISVRSCWFAALQAQELGTSGAEIFLRELVWREFAYHLLFHFPHIENENWRSNWNDFPWREDNELAERWRRGTTGIPVIDAAMRQMYATGTMHNRARMLVGSYLTKHLMTHWRVGQAWFSDCLIDWDPAANAMGWQWIAGSGPDAAPFFRVFNPDLQAGKFDANLLYRKRYVAELSDQPPKEAMDFFAAIPNSWAMSENDSYRPPVIGIGEGRARALGAYRVFSGAEKPTTSDVGDI